MEKNVVKKLVVKKVKLVENINSVENIDSVENINSVDSVSDVLSKKIKQIDKTAITSEEKEQVNRRLQEQIKRERELERNEQEEFEKILEKLRIEDEKCVLVPSKSSNYTSSEEWYLLVQLEPNILKDTLNTLYLETIKFENGLAQKPTIEYCLSMTLDNQKQGKQGQDKQGQEKQEVIYTNEDRIKIKENFLKRFENL